MSTIFDVVIALLIVSTVTFVLTHILGLVAIILPSPIYLIITFVIALQLVLFVIHRRD